MVPPDGPLLHCGEGNPLSTPHDHAFRLYGFEAFEERHGHKYKKAKDVLGDDTCAQDTHISE